MGGEGRGEEWQKVEAEIGARRLLQKREGQ